MREGGDLVGLIRLATDWHEPGTFESRNAWVVDWTAEDLDVMQRSLVELDGEPTTEHDRIVELSEKAKAVVELGPPMTPLPFGSAATGLTTNTELRELIELSVYAADNAGGRVSTAAQSTKDDAAMPLNVSIVEAVGWLRAVDELLDRVWRLHVSRADREAVSVKVDQWLSGPGMQPGLLAAEQAERQANGQPYADWLIALLSRGVYVEREEMRAFRWLAGKLLHHGPLSAVELQHWRAGEPARWKWRSADKIYPPALKEQQPTQRAAYNSRLAGRDVMGTLSFTTTLITAEYLFLPLLP